MISLKMSKDGRDKSKQSWLNVFLCFNSSQFKLFSESYWKEKEAEELADYYDY